MKTNHVGKGVVNDWEGFKGVVASPYPNPPCKMIGGPPPLHTAVCSFKEFNVIDMIVK